MDTVIAGLIVLIGYLGLVAAVYGVVALFIMFAVNLVAAGTLSYLQALGITILLGVFKWIVTRAK